MTRRIKINHNQLTLPFGEVLASAGYESRERAFWFLISVSLLSLALYTYAINATAHHIAVRENLEREVAGLAAELGTLEFASISLRNAVTMERAIELGFHEVGEPLFVSRTPNISLTLNTVR
ncbi:MAG: hypothetical protein HYT69_00260 [Candidatus Zambryskibacteria bacterium]|nr:hypothetical protein [Candidatus Zambryskibacteria bacterium]